MPSIVLSLRLPVWRFSSSSIHLYVQYSTFNLASILKVVVFRPLRALFTYAETCGPSHARRSWSLSIEGSFIACHFYFDTTQNIRSYIPRARDTCAYCWAFGNARLTVCLNDLGLSRPGFEHANFCIRRKLSTSQTLRRCFMRTVKDY